jgi:hypothetical protein
VPRIAAGAHWLMMRQKVVRETSLDMRVFGRQHKLPFFIADRTASGRLLGRLRALN